jgi:hypothetical protein
VATFSTHSLAAGAHSLTAAYAGGGSYAASASSALSVTVNKAASAIVLASSANPVVAGQQVTFTATVSGAAGTPTGSVTFRDGSSVLATVPLNGSGVATYSTSSLAVGAHTIYANYGGSATYGISAAGLHQSISQSTTTNIAGTPNPAAVGQTVTLTATVKAASGISAGVVTFKDGATVLGTASLVNGVATFSTHSLAVGTHSLTAAYAASAGYAASVSTPLSEVIH